MKRLNWNYRVKVKLTSQGRYIFLHRYDDLIQTGAAIKQELPIEDEDGFCEFQLWDFMQLYGQHIGMGFPKIVEDLSFYIEDDVLEDVKYLPEVWPKFC